MTVSFHGAVIAFFIDIDTVTRSCHTRNTFVSRSLHGSVTRVPRECYAKLKSSHCGVIQYILTNESFCYILLMYE